MKNITARIKLRLLYIVIVLLTMTGCSLTLANKDTLQEFPADAPLSEFILGSWKTEHVYLPNGDESPFGFDITFVDSDTIEVVTVENGDPTEITISQYSFIAPNIIFEDNKRIRGGVTWFLERKGQKLKVLMDIDDGKDGITLVLMRNKPGTTEIFR